jgi:hypothetical protein
MLAYLALEKQSEASTNAETAISFTTIVATIEQMVEEFKTYSPLTLTGEEDSLEDSLDHEYTSVSIMRCLLCVFARIVKIPTYNDGVL